MTEFDSEDEAIAALREIRDEDGDAPLLEFALLRFQNGSPTLIAKEGDLVRHVARAKAQTLATARGG